jgi:hypothetical protein
MGLGDQRGDWGMGDALAKLREERDAEKSNVGKKVLWGIIIVLGIVLLEIGRRNRKAKKGRKIKTQIDLTIQLINKIYIISLAV